MCLSRVKWTPKTSCHITYYRKKLWIKSVGSTKKEMQPIVLGQMEEIKWKLLWLIRKLKMHILSWLSPEHTLRLSVCLKCFALVQILESFKLSHAYFMITHLLIHSIHTGYLPPTLSGDLYVVVKYTCAFSEHSLMKR